MGNKVKIKTNKAAAKRFKVTGSGNVKFRRANRAHINTKRSTKQMRQARRNGLLSNSDARTVKMMLNLSLA